MVQSLVKIEESEMSLVNTHTVSTAQDKTVIRHGAYRIEQTPSNAFPFEKHPVQFVLGSSVGWVVWFGYLFVQSVFIKTLDGPSATLKQCLWVGLLAEFLLGFVDCNWALDAVIPMLRERTRSRRPHYKLLDGSAPHVDVFVTCCGEPVEVIMNTVGVAAAQTYPASHFNVVVLDDGHDESLRQAVEMFNKENSGFVKVYYRSRTVKPGTRTYFKAGNLGFGIRETKELTNGEFVASLDADMIVSPEWLQSLVPHLLLDTKIGLVTSPQNQYNVPKGDLLAQQAEFMIWNTIYEPIHDYVGEAMCMGTGFVARRAALEDIGGWPLAEMGEDYMCSTKLVEKGWQIAYVRENLQHGITPESYQSRVKQRIRWVDAAFEVHRNNKWYLTNDFGEGVTLLDKASSMLFAVRDLAAVSTLFALLALPVAMLVLLASSAGGHSLLSSPHYSLLNKVLILWFVSGKICDWLVYRHIGLSHLSNLQSLDVWCAPYCALRCISQFLGSASTKSPVFFVTGAFVCPTNERSGRSTRAPLLHRLFSTGIPFHLVYTTLTTALLIYCTFTCKTSSVPILPGHLLLLARCTWKVSVPVTYMLFPPTVPAWKDHLFPCRDDKQKEIWRPKWAFPRYVTPGQKLEWCGGAKDASEDEIGEGWTRQWRDAIEVLVLAVALYK